jgi:hypothetical protein
MILSSTHATQAAIGYFQLRLLSTDRVPSALGPNFKLRSTIPRRVAYLGVCPAHSTTSQCCGTPGQPAGRARGILLTTVTVQSAHVVQSRDFTASGTSSHYYSMDWEAGMARVPNQLSAGPFRIHGIPCQCRVGY